MRGDDRLSAISDETAVRGARWPVRRFVILNLTYDGDTKPSMRRDVSFLKNVCFDGKNRDETV
jgi:hypothetical protein